MTPGRSASLLLFIQLSLVSAANYTVSTPNVRVGCTARCRSTAEDGRWRCDDVVSSTGEATTVCNTFELADTDHTCHFHYFSQDEVATCLGGQAADVIFLGDPHASGLSWTMYPWFDPATDTSEVYDQYAWMAQANVNGEYNITNGGIEPYPLVEDRIPDWNLMLASHVMLNDKAEVQFKTAQTNHTEYEIYDMMLHHVPQETAGQWSMTHLNAISFDRANQALDAIQRAGRQNRKAYVFVSLGSWDYDAYNNCTVACPFIGGDAVEIVALSADHTKKGEQAFLDFIEESLRAFIERAQEEFPNYTLFVSDDPGIPYTGRVGRGMSHLIRQVAEDYSNSHFLASYDMANLAEKHSSLVNGHGVGIFNQNVFQRMMSIACNQDSLALTECEEEIVGESACQFSTIPASSLWWEHWYRPCFWSRFTSDTIMTTISPSVPSAPRTPVGPTKKPNRPSTASSSSSLSSASSAANAIDSSSPTTTASGGDPMIDKAMKGSQQWVTNNIIIAASACGGALLLLGIVVMYRKRGPTPHAMTVAPKGKEGLMVVALTPPVLGVGFQQLAGKNVDALPVPMSP